MCIEILPGKMVVKVGQQSQLWKLIRPDNHIGIWSETYSEDNRFTESSGIFHLGINVAKNFEVDDNNGGCRPMPAQFHCFFTYKAAQDYTRYRDNTGYGGVKRPTKIIKVYANSEDVVSIGYDRGSGIRAISVCKMEIKSLNHQR